ncbi:PHA/PHB synthase family protein [Acidimangrovimonas pyrenivorans]|uniref:PHA/PHB synthase family protein n=1 Tax=Acidimangrovimonas pyrenivorans TaxID=2030798 RepID=A0ABV7AGL3_9RHOB
MARNEVKPAPAPVESSIESAAESPEKRAAEASFEQLDRRLHARIGEALGGLSLIDLVGAWADWASHMAIAPGKQAELVWKASRKWQKLNEAAWCQLSGQQTPEPCIAPLPQDRRFRAPEWQRFPYNLIYQSFLLNQQWWHNATTEVHGVDAKNEALVEFYARQVLDMLSPSNFLATNPQLLDRTVKEGGRNLVRGLAHWLEDVQRAVTGAPRADTEAFRPGREVAVTPGKVVYRNRLMELIQYAPATETVHSVPVLIVPAWIMKYYILDLTPEHSLIRWLVGQGFTVFCISWKNPDEGDRDLGLDDYRELGVMDALDAVCAITGAETVHGMGYCLGGTLLSVAAAAMGRDGDGRLATLSMLAAQVDFSEAGELSLFVSEAQLALLEDMMWDKGYLDQRRMAGTFTMLRSQDLLWSHMVHDYLMGERDGHSDLGAWSADATRMPYRMHSEYLRHMFLNDDLAEGRLEAGGETVFLPDIRVPVFAVATEHDHIAPWHSVFKLTYLLHGDIDFALVSGGHNTGIVAPPGNPKAGYRLLKHRSGDRHSDPDDWAAAIPRKAGSWWEPWRDWLVEHGDNDVPPPPLGRKEAGYPPLAEAPGDYVRAP